MSAVLVSHPHATAVSHGLAACLARSGKLGAFVTGVAASEGTAAGRLFRRLARHRPVIKNRIMPADELRWHIKMFEEPPVMGTEKYVSEASNFPFVVNR